MVLWHVNNMKVILTCWRLNWMLIVFFFLYWFFPYCSQSSQLIWKNLILKFSKNMIKPPLIWFMYLTLSLISKLCWVWWNQMVNCLYYINYTKIYSKNVVSVNELALNAKNVMPKTSGNAFAGNLGVSFSYFSRLHLMMGGACQYLLWIFVDHVTIFSLSSKQYQRWALLQKMSNSWKPLLAVVTKSFIVNVIRFLDPILKRIYKFRFRQ